MWAGRCAGKSGRRGVSPPTHEPRFSHRADPFVNPRAFPRRRARLADRRRFRPQLRCSAPIIRLPARHAFAAIWPARPPSPASSWQARSVICSLGHGAVVLFSAALVVELGLVSALAFANSHLRERARDVIADVEAPVFAAEIAAECAALAGQRRRERLARSLARALQAAEHWHRLSITSRPPPTVRHVLACGDTRAR